MPAARRVDPEARFRANSSALRAKGIIAALAVALAATSAAAQAIDLSHGGPIRISAVGGIEWERAKQVVIAEGDARAVRNGVTVLADRLIAHYRPRRIAPSGPSGLGVTRGNEIYLLEASGHVRIFTASDEAKASRAVYDIDQAVLVLSGAPLTLSTPQEMIRARNSLEYWSVKRMAVARGQALVSSRDGRRVAADTLVGYFSPVNPAAVKAANDSAQPDALASAGQLKLVDAIGHVVITAPTEVARGDRAVYDPRTGWARLGGHVRITRDQNQLDGADAIVNLNTGVAQLTPRPGGRVEGLVVPESTSAPSSGASAGGGAK